MSIDIKKNKLSTISRYRPEIDGLRAFAVITVISNHFNKDILPNGYLGVDIFFVISGFVITSSLYQRRNKNFKDFISGFYERRIKRLVPALSAFVLITSIAICLFNPYPRESLQTGLTSLFGVSNLYLFKISTDYFAQSTLLNVFTHTWSLGVEEQFYILFPFLAWFSGFGHQSKNGARNLFLIVVALTITSLIGFIYLYPLNQSAAYFLMPTRFWEMASGCLLFIGLQKRKYIEQFFEMVPPILVIACIIGVMYLPMSLARASTVLVVFLTLVLITSLKEGKTLYAFLTHPKVVYIGLISYSLYLWHWGVLSLSRWTIGIHWWSVPFQVTLMFGLAVASYQWIETPLRKKNWFGKRWKTFMVGGGVIFTLSGGLIALKRPLKSQLYTGKLINTAEPNFLKGKKCLENISNKTECYLVNNNSKQTLWLLGDSHAKKLALAGEEVSNSLGINMKLYLGNATSFPPVGRYQKLTINGRQLLDDFKIVEKELYKQMKVGDVIALFMRMPAHFGGSYSSTNRPFIVINEEGSHISKETIFNEWITSIENLADIAEKKGAKIIIQTPIPEWIRQRQFRRCSTSDIQWFNSLNKINCEIKSKFFIDKETGIYKHLFEKLNELSTSHKNIYLFDTYKIVCPESICSFTRDGVDIYADDDHLSFGWARDFLAPKMSKFINEIQIMDK